MEEKDSCFKPNDFVVVVVVATVQYSSYVYVLVVHTVSHYTDRHFLVVIHLTDCSDIVNEFIFIEDHNYSSFTKT